MSDQIEKLREAYAAHVLGWTPAETQAAIWAGTLKRSGRNVPVVSIELV